MAILNPTAPTVLPNDVLACFRGSPRLDTLSGPVTLYRLAGSKTAGGRWARDQEFGAWWFGSEMLDALADDLLEAEYDGNREMRRNILAGTRTDLAVLRQWSDMAWFCMLKLGAADAVWAWSGPAEQQQDRGGGFYDGMLPGGGTQYFIADLGNAPGAPVSKHPTHSIMAMLRRNPGWRG